MFLSAADRMTATLWLPAGHITGGAGLRPSPVYRAQISCRHVSLSQAIITPDGFRHPEKSGYFETASQ
jgi:hypothetical protein